MQSPPSTSANSPAASAPAHSFGGLGRARHDGVEVLGVRVLAIGPPAPDLGVAVIDHLDTGRLEPGEQAGVAQRAGRLLLPRRIGAGARRHADHTQRSRHHCLRTFSPNVSGRQSGERAAAASAAAPRERSRTPCTKHCAHLRARRSSSRLRRPGSARPARRDAPAPPVPARAHRRSRSARFSCGSASAYIGSRGSSGRRPRCGRAR